jgi:hypothetical protein
VPHAARFGWVAGHAANAAERRRASSWDRWRSVVAMQATWSQPVDEVVVFSNDFARRGERPRRPWAASTRQGCRMGRKVGLLVGLSFDMGAQGLPDVRTTHPSPEPMTAATPLRRFAGADLTLVGRVNL